MNREETKAALLEDLGFLERHDEGDLIVYDPFIGGTTVLGEDSETYTTPSMGLVGQIAHFRTVGFAREMIRLALEQIEREG